MPRKVHGQSFGQIGGFLRLAVAVPHPFYGAASGIEPSTHGFSNPQPAPQKRRDYTRSPMFASAIMSGAGMRRGRVAKNQKKLTGNEQIPQDRYAGVRIWGRIRGNHPSGNSLTFTIGSQRYPKTLGDPHNRDLAAGPGWSHFRLSHLPHDYPPI